MAANTSDPGEYLARDEEREQIAECIGEESVLDLDQIVLMAAERVAAEVIHAVVINAYHVGETELVDRSYNLPLAGTVVRNQIF